MTFEQLEYFIAVTELDTFLNAAESLHISQSSLSKQIIKLEKELGIMLLDRSRRSASLTEAGDLFYKDAKKLSLQYQEMLSKMNLYRESNLKSLRVGTLPILTQYHLTALFQKFSVRHPEIVVAIDEVEEINLLKGLEDGCYDLIIAREHMLDPQKQVIYPVASDELVAVLPVSHPLASAPALTLKDLQDENFILMNRYTAIFQLCMEKFAKEELNLKLSRTARVESILSAVAIGEGISLLPKSNLNIFHHQDIIAVSLHPAIPLSVVLAKQKRQKSSPALNLLIQFLTQTE